MQINKYRIKERLFELSEIGGNPSVGWTRLAFSNDDQQGRKLIKQYMDAIGLEIYEDQAGNIFGRLEGKEEAPTIAIGSHIDTVPNGGMFDGALGVISGLEVIQTIKEMNGSLKYPLEVVVFANEEGSRFNTGLTGSRAMAGHLSKDELDLVDSDGISLSKAMMACGLNPSNIDEAKVSSDKYKAFLEIHIEQSDRLELANKTIGLVDTVAGQLVVHCVVYGKANHSGTTVMTRRKDALVEASKVVVGIHEMALEIGGNFVATVGKFHVFPNSVNSIPGKVEFTVDIRDTSKEKVTQGFDQLHTLINKIIGEDNFEMNVLEEQHSTTLSTQLLTTAQSVCERENYSYQYVASGACHDSQVMSTLTESSLIFIPSVNGVSHCPEEDVYWEDVYIGAELLLNMVLEI